MCLGDAIDLFLSQYKESSAISYGSQLKDLGKSYLSFERKLGTIDSLDLIRYMGIVDSRPQIQSPVTYNKYVKTFRTFFNWCVKLELIDASPAKALKKKSIRESVPKSKAMPPSTLSRLLTFYDNWEKVNDDPRPLALFRFLSDTGCRIGGAAGLTRDRLILDKPISQDGQDIYRVLLFEKGREEPNIYYFSTETAKTLRRWVLRHSGENIFSQNGTGIKANNLARQFRRWTVRAGCGSWGPHSLRHAKGHHAARHLPLSIAAKILNDSEEIFIKYYAPKEDRFVQEGAAVLFADKAKNHEIITLETRTS